MKTQKRIRKPDRLLGFRWLSWVVVCGLGCSGCYQPTVVPPTASIAPPKQPAITIPSAPEQNEPLSPPSQLPIDPIKSSNPWKPEAELRDWEYIVLHHTASNAGSVESIHEEHLNRKDKNGNAWLGIGYHFVIGNGNGMEDGQIESTFRWKQQIQGAHAGVANYNQHGIGIVLIGNFDNGSPTEAQTSSVMQLVGVLKREYGIAANNVIGHGDIKATDCPGKFFPLNLVRGGVAWNGHRALHLSWKDPGNDRRSQNPIENEELNRSNRWKNPLRRDEDVELAWTILPGDALK